MNSPRCSIFPSAEPYPISAIPFCDITAKTSAKSTFIFEGFKTIFATPLTAFIKTSFTFVNAFSIGVSGGKISKTFSLSTSIRESTFSIKLEIPFFA